MGILDGKPLGLGRADALQAQRESDVIFGCVFLGMLRDALGEGVTLRWDVESDDPTVTEVQRLELQQVLTALQERTGVDAPPLTAGWSPEYNGKSAPQVAIAGTSRPRNPEQSEKARKPVDWHPEVARHVEKLLKNDELMIQNMDKEFGAYYGIVDAGDNTVPKVIGSVRRLIPYGSEGGRWSRGVLCHGLIGYDDPKRALTARQSPKQATSIEPTPLISQWNGENEVCGYCHGMVWAVGQVRSDFPDDGRPFELAVGKNTHKLSSCFGCSTFLHANGYAPSSMHLGRSDSWVPLPEGGDAPAPFGLDTRDVSKDAEVFAELNRVWARKVAGWMRRGVRLVTEAKAGDYPPASVETGWRLAHVISERHEPRAVANLFLDALTVHDKDLPRLKRFVGL